MDLWQLRSHSAISSSPTQADMMARFDADVPFSTVVGTVRAEHARRITLALADRAAVPEQRAERAALDAHVGAKQVLAVEVEERAADRRLQERDAALMSRRGPGVFAFTIVADQRGRVRRQQVVQVTVHRRLHATARPPCDRGARHERDKDLEGTPHEKRRAPIWKPASLNYELE